jgi:hypothetical protein
VRACGAVCCACRSRAVVQPTPPCAVWLPTWNCGHVGVVFVAINAIISLDIRSISAGPTVGTYRTGGRGLRRRPRQTVRTLASPDGNSFYTTAIGCAAPESYLFVAVSATCCQYVASAKVQEQTRHWLTYLSKRYCCKSPAVSSWTGRRGVGTVTERNCTCRCYHEIRVPSAGCPSFRTCSHRART